MSTDNKANLLSFNIEEGDFVKRITVAAGLQYIVLKRAVLEYFAICNNVAHSLEPGETPSNSKLCTTFLKTTKHGEITEHFQFTGTATELEMFVNLIMSSTVQRLAMNKRTKENPAERLAVKWCSLV